MSSDDGYKSQGISCDYGDDRGDMSADYGRRGFNSQDTSQSSSRNRR